MGTLIESTNRFNVFVFDLEYIGVPNSLEECYIWEIAAIHLLSGRSFSVTIDPGIRPLPERMGEEFADVTESFLKEKMAVPFETGWAMFLQFLQSYEPVLLISHNNFKSDKLMLEIEAKRRKVHLPYTWYFMDSLLFCRKAIPKQTSYTLKDLYRSIHGKEIVNNHSALPDAKALADILYYIGLGRISGPIYPSYCTSLQVVKWLGPACERMLFQNNVRSLEQLVANVVSGFHGSRYPLRQYIQYYINNLCGMNIGNSSSIAKSIAEKWLPHV